MGGFEVKKEISAKSKQKLSYPGHFLGRKQKFLETAQPQILCSCLEQRESKRR
jgi:hypothetical protein